MMHEHEIRINQIAQNFVPLSDGLNWFIRSEEELQKRVLHSLYTCCAQCHPDQKEIEAAIVNSRLKPSYTPCIIAASQKGDISEKLWKIANLPKNEWAKAFALLASVLAVSDNRRRSTECKNGCSHEWHNLQSIQEKEPK